MTKRRLMFVVTSDKNMGDLAFCQDWENNIGHDDFEYFYVLGEALGPYIAASDGRAYFEPARHVKETIRAAAEQFRPDAIFFATNSYWNIEGQRGAEVGFFDETLRDLRIPLLSIDVYEGDNAVDSPWHDQSVLFDAVPDYVWALRMLTSEGGGKNVRHFRMESIVDDSLHTPDAGLLERLGIRNAEYHIVFPVSRDRQVAIQGLYYDYYAYLAKVFEGLQGDGIQIVVLSSEPVAEFAHLENVSDAGLVSFDDFMRLLRRCDAFMTDSVVSSMLHAIHTATPSLALLNRHESLDTLPEFAQKILRVGWLHEERGEPWTRLREKVERVYLGEKMFPSMVFPYGLHANVSRLVHRYGLQGTFHCADIFDIDDLQAQIYNVATNDTIRRGLITRCKSWRDSRLKNPSPREVIEDILSQPLLF